MILINPQDWRCYLRMRIRFVIFIIFVFNFLISQNSLLSLNGFGEHLNIRDGSSLGLGESRMFSSNSISLSSISSYSNVNSSFLAMSLSFNQYQIENIDNINSNVIEFLSYNFPVSENTIFSIAMNPIFRTNLQVSELDNQIFGADVSTIDLDNDGINDPVAYNSDYDFDGGISEFSSGISTKFSKNLNIGFKIGKIFGSSTRISNLRLYQVSYNQSGEIDYDLFSTQNFSNSYSYSSYNFLIDIRFSMPQLNHRNEFVLIYEKSDNMNINMNLNDSEESQSFETLKEMSNFGFGFKMNFSDSFSFLFEMNDFKFFKSNNLLNIFNNDYPDYQSFHIGFNNNFKKYNMNYGLCFKNYNLNNYNILDVGLTFGFGFKFLEYNNFDFGLKFGKRSSDFYELHDEKYFKLYMTIISLEKWFIKKRK